MLDVETYLVTKENLNATIMRHVEPQTYICNDASDDGKDSSLGNLIGRGIALILVLGALMYFYFGR